LIAVGLVMASWELWRRDQSWMGLGWQISGLSAGAALAMAPYMFVIGGITNKATGIDVLHAKGSGGNIPAGSDMLLRWLPHGRGSASIADCGFPFGVSYTPSADCGNHRFFASPGLEIFAAPMAVYWSDIKNSPRLQRICWSVWAVATEIAKATNYSGWLPGLLGLYIFRRKFLEGPDSWLLPVLCGLQVLLLCRVAYVAGYVADRHVLLFLVCGAPWAVATVFAIGQAVASHLTPVAARLTLIPETMRLHNGHGLCGAFLAGLIVFPLPKTLEPLHANRAGYHAAGQWLAQNADAADAIIDPFSWAEYYSGRTLREQRTAPADHRPCQYIVLGCSDNEHVRLPLIPYAEELASQGETVYQWSPLRAGCKAEAVAIYRVATDAKAGGGRVEGRLTSRPTGSREP
jgi:hypothetical protein